MEIGSRKARLVIHDSVGPRETGVKAVWELLSAKDSPNMSVAVIELLGTNDCVRNTKCDAAYYVNEGSGVFSLEIEGQMLDLPVVKGDLVYIPKGAWYRDRGFMTLISFCTPAWSIDQVEKKNP